MTIYTIGVTQKTAEQFFGLIENNEIDLVIDVRLNNKSQLAGFTKGSDLDYFLRKICGAKYVHCVEFAPTKDLLDRYHKGITSWDEYVDEFRGIMTQRGDYQRFLQRFHEFDRVCLLCSEPTPEKCHRRLLAEMIAESADTVIEVVHL